MNLTKLWFLQTQGYFREPQPRYDNNMFPTRSTFARFLDHPHEHGFWWQLEEQERYEGKDRAIGYPIECLIHVFHRSVASLSTENKTRDEAEPQIDDEPLTVKRPRRVTISDEPVELAAPAEYGEEEIEIPEIPIGGLQLARQPADGELQVVPADDRIPEVVEWSSVDLGTTLRELKSTNKALADKSTS
jgi:hypothetical protein